MPSEVILEFVAYSFGAKSLSAATKAITLILRVDGKWVCDGFTMTPATSIRQMPLSTDPVPILSGVCGRAIRSSRIARANWEAAGGVGGLLMLVRSDAPNNHFVPLMDRMGNVTGYRRASLASAIPAAELPLSASYDYYAFGRELKSTGLWADSLPFHFSTKFTDEETGLNYYGYRLYDAGKGRWLSRDPIGEKGGVNLYGMVGNDAVGRWDWLGLTESSRHPDIYDNHPASPKAGDSCCVERMPYWKAQGYNDIWECVVNHPAIKCSVTSNNKPKTAVLGGIGAGLTGVGGAVASVSSNAVVAGSGAVAAGAATAVGGWDAGNLLFRLYDCGASYCNVPGVYVQLTNSDYGSGPVSYVQPLVCQPQ